MTNLNERKEVAESLRKNADAHKDMPLLLNVAFAAFGDDARDLMEETVTSQMAAHRLADLIDPTCEIEPAGKVPKKVADNLNTWICSECGSPIYNDMTPTYCPYCGARVVNTDE